MTFSPCPFCKQYSHSIGEDRLAAAFNTFQSMFSHRNDGIPTQFCFDEKVRDAAQVLMAAAVPKFQCDPVHVEDDGWSEWLHPKPGFLSQCCDCGLIHEMEVAIGQSDGPPCNDGETGEGVVLFRMRRAPASAIEARSDATGTGAAEGESAVPKADAQ